VVGKLTSCVCVCLCVQLSRVIGGLVTKSRCLTDDMLETLIYSVQSVSFVSLLSLY